MGFYKKQTLNQANTNTTQKHIMTSKPKYYITKTKSKQRFPNQTELFRQKTYHSDSEISNRLWEIINNYHSPNVVRPILRNCLPYNPTITICSLLLNQGAI